MCEIVFAVAGNTKSSNGNDDVGRITGRMEEKKKRALFFCEHNNNHIIFVLLWHFDNTSNHWFLWAERASFKHFYCGSILYDISVTSNSSQWKWPGQNVHFESD